METHGELETECYLVRTNTKYSHMASITSFSFASPNISNPESFVTYGAQALSDMYQNRISDMFT
jgi:hypothetical protein